MSKIFANSKHENTIVGHEYSAYILRGLYRGDGEYDESDFNLYTVRNNRVWVSRSVHRGAVTRWVRLYQWPNEYTVTVTDTIKYKGVMYDNVVFSGTFFSLRSAINAMYAHKSDR